MQDVPRSSLAFWVAPDAEDARKDADEDDYPDVRNTIYRSDRKIHKDEELDGSDDEDDIDYGYATAKRRRNHSSTKPPPTKPSRNYYSHSKDFEYTTHDRVTLKSKATVSETPRKMMGVGQRVSKYSPAKPFTTSTQASPAGSTSLARKVVPRNPADDPRCESCKIGKTKCDRARPFCSTCVRRNRQDRCLYARMDGTIGPDPGAEAALALVENIAIGNMELD